MARLGSIAAVLRLRSPSRVSALIAACARRLGRDEDLRIAVNRCLEHLRCDLVPVPLRHRESYPAAVVHAGPSP